MFKAITYYCHLLCLLFPVCLKLALGKTETLFSNLCFQTEPPSRSSPTGNKSVGICLISCLFGVITVKFCDVIVFLV